MSILVALNLSCGIKIDIVKKKVKLYRHIFAFDLLCISETI
jgi:hypothetical protein